jgi:hypothetical protein
MKDFPEIMLFDRKNDFHMLHNLADERPNIVNKGFKYLETWHTKMMIPKKYELDPMWTVIKEGGPFHCRGMLERYKKRLKETDREHLIEKILDRKEAYE